MLTTSLNCFFVNDSLTNFAKDPAGRRLVVVSGNDDKAIAYRLIEEYANQRKAA